MAYFLLFLVMVAGLILITRPLTTFFHELGHAIPALLLTRQKVTIYIGSHGDPKKSLRLNLGVLDIFFRYNPFAWRLGLCVPSAKSISINKQITYILAGPFASFILAAVACYFTFVYDVHGFLKLLLIVFLGSALFDLIVNLIPFEAPVKLYDGGVTYNDGYLLKELFYFRKLPKEYSEATELFYTRQYADAAHLFGKMLADGCKDENIYRGAVYSYIHDKNYEKAKEFSDVFVLTGKMNSDDLSNMALSYSNLGFHDEALKLYDRSLQLNPDNVYSLNNKGYTLSLLNKFEEAIPFFDKVIQLHNKASLNQDQ